MNKIATLTLLVLGIISINYLFSCQSNLSIETAQYAVNGQKLYTTHCQNCHGAKGEGLGKLYPPLTDTSYLEKNRELLSCIVKNGLKCEIVINGVKYNEIMPANTNLTDTDIAYILTYITTHFGKKDTTYSTEEVKRNLQNCK